MKNIPALCVLLGMLGACQSPQPEQQTSPAAPVAAPPAEAATLAPNAAPDAAADKARQWLIASIEDNFNTPGKDEANIDIRNGQSIYTRQYRDYKLDAIQLEYGGEEEEKAFLKKWEGRYQTQYAGSGSFLFSGQDYGQVQVTRCELKESTQDQAFVFAVTTRDLTFKSEGKGDIKVIQTADGLKIDDVREY